MLRLRTGHQEKVCSKTGARLPGQKAWSDSKIIRRGGQPYWCEAALAAVPRVDGFYPAYKASLLNPIDVLRYK